MTTNTYFITGTDTNIGKTYISTQLLNTYTRAGFNTFGCKLIASDCKMINEQLINIDALSLRQASSLQLDYSIHNPFAFQPAISPHIAAKLVNTPLSLALLREKFRLPDQHDNQINIIEGAGGWLLPLNEKETLAEFVVEQQFQIILVVGMRLGCLNHTLLTAQSIMHMGGKLVGWIANCVDSEMEYLDENIATLQEMLSVPLLGQAKWNDKIKTLLQSY